MRAQEKFRIVEIIKVIDRCSCAEFDSLDLLKINVEYSLLSRCLTAVFYPLERLFYAVPSCPLNNDGREELSTVKYPGSAV